MQVVDLPEPAPGPGQVLIAVQAAGIVLMDVGHGIVGKRVVAATGSIARLGCSAIESNVAACLL
jgi:D-arabinose 1-dehydrogenase-like Zn-dependent alcohol dehydrogenase